MPDYVQGSTANLPAGAAERLRACVAPAIGPRSSRVI